MNEEVPRGEGGPGRLERIGPGCGTRQTPGLEPGGG